MKRRAALAPMRHAQGMSLVEVLVAVLVVSIGLLGAAGLHVRAIDYTIDTERRQMAAMVASELMETLRGDAATVLANGVPKADLGGYAKAAHTALATVTAAECQPLPTQPARRLGCWGVRARQLMPELTDDLLTERFTVALDAASSVVSVTVAWPVKAGQCLSATADDTDEYCTYTLQSRL